MAALLAALAGLCLWMQVAAAQEIVEVPANLTTIDLTPTGVTQSSAQPNVLMIIPGDSPGTKVRFELAAVGLGPTFNWRVYTIRNPLPQERKLVLLVNDQRFAGSGILMPRTFGEIPDGIALSAGQETLERQVSQSGVALAFRIKPLATVTIAVEGNNASHAVSLSDPTALAARDAALSFLRGGVLAVALFLAFGMLALFGVRRHASFLAGGFFAVAAAAFMALEGGYLAALLPRLSLGALSMDMLRAFVETTLLLALAVCLFSFNGLGRRGALAAGLGALIILLTAANVGLAAYDPLRATSYARLGFAVLVVLGLVIGALVRKSSYPVVRQGLLLWSALASWALIAGVIATTARVDSGQHAVVLIGLVLVLALMTFTLVSFAFSQGVLARPLLTDANRRSLALASADHYVWDWQPFDDRLDISADLAKALGYDTRAWAAAPGATFRSILHPDDMPTYQLLMDERQLAAGTFHELELRLRHADGQYRWFALRAKVLPSGGMGAARCIGTLTDITRNKVTEDRLISDAAHDPVTGLPSRAIFLDRLVREIESPLARPVRVLLVGLERFKNLNDGLGHDLGDHLLLVAGRRIADQLLPDEAASRISGSQFAVMFVETIDGRDVMTLADNIRRAIAAPVPIGERNVYLSVLIGISRTSNEVAGPEQLQEQAATALHEAQREGGASVRVYEMGQQDDRAAHVDLESSLRRAIEDRAIEVMYQPIVHLETQAIVGLEALARWRTADGTLLPPIKFLGLAEQVGLLPAITDIVLSESIRQMGIWQRTLTRERPVYMAINLSAEELNDLAFVDRLRLLIVREGVRPNTIKIEITESVAMRYPDRARQFVQRLQALGVGVACDDFGTGFSSLSSLRDLPFDTLKIDRSFLVAEALEGRGGVIVDTVVNLAHGLGMLVVAEGIENEAQASRLLALGCDLGQGYHYSEALPAREIEGHLAVLPRLQAPVTDPYVQTYSAALEEERAEAAEEAVLEEQELFEEPSPDESMFDDGDDPDEPSPPEAEPDRSPPAEPEILPSIFAVGKGRPTAPAAPQRKAKATTRPKLKKKGARTAKKKSR